MEDKDVSVINLPRVIESKLDDEGHLLIPIDRGEEDYYILARIARDCDEAMKVLPRGKRGLVVGSEKATRDWKDKGWVTLDTNKEHEPDFTLDFNEAGNYPYLGKFDYILIEGVPIDKDGKAGIEPNRLVEISSGLLNSKGKLVIQTVSHDKGESKFPAIREFVEILRGSNFSVEVKRSVPVSITSQKSSTELIQRSVVYYSEKVI